MNRKVLIALNEQLIHIRQANERLMEFSQEHQLPFALKNCEKIMACIEMMELHVCDPLTLIQEE